MENLSAIIAIAVIFLGVPLGILGLRDLLRRIRVRNPMFWCLAPILFIFAAVMPLCIDGWTPTRVILMAGMELCVVFALIGLFDTRRFSWAFRGLAAVI